VIYAFNRDTKVVIPKVFFKISLFIFIISILALVTSFVTEYKVETLVFSISMLLKCIFINVFILTAIKSKNKLSTLDFILKSYLILIFFIVLFQYLTGGAGSPSAFYNGRNELIAIFLPISLYVSYYKKVNPLFVVLSFVTIAITRGRVGMAIFLLSSFFILFSSRKNIKYVIFFILFTYLALLFIPSEVYDELYYRFILSIGAEAADGRGSTGVREVLYTNIFRYIHESYTYMKFSFGLGESGFSKLSSSFYGLKEMGYQKLQPHNSYLGLFVNFGFFSLLSFLSFAYYTLQYVKIDRVIFCVCLSLFLNLLSIDFIPKYSIYLILCICFIHTYFEGDTTNTNQDRVPPPVR